MVSFMDFDWYIYDIFYGVSIHVCPFVDVGNSVIACCLLVHLLPDARSKSDCDKIVLFTSVSPILFCAQCHV